MKVLTLIQAGGQGGRLSILGKKRATVSDDTVY
jgi:ADP-glucose pyrophosphorylase